MTISQDPTAPLIVLVGITGLQGGSVARALIESNKSYRPAAEAFAAQGVQIVGVSLTIENALSVQKAFNGADIAFVSKMLVDTAKLIGVKLLVWSGLALSNGKFSRVGFFDAKKAVTDMRRTLAGYYASNIFEAPYALKKQLGGSYAFGLPTPPTTQVPLIDVAHDHGLYVRAAIEDPSLGAGSEVLSGRLISFGEIVATLAEVSGKKIEYLEMDRETFIAATGMPDYGPMLSDMFEAFAVHGYYGGKETTNERLLARKPRLWSEFLAVVQVKELLK
ncbi:NAD(P)-binding protein [Favolaschia claudopus]|uniref:NAD(P)-binding protein n=1 Tax=Favolaschia claudopus TaxID=2862362 RepID=A0AAW0DS07_9AGAR